MILSLLGWLQFYSIIAEGRRKKEEGRRKKENTITVMVSVIKNVLTTLAVALYQNFLRE